MVRDLEPHVVLALSRDTSKPRSKHGWFRRGRSRCRYPCRSFYQTVDEVRYILRAMRPSDEEEEKRLLTGTTTSYITELAASPLGRLKDALARGDSEFEFESFEVDDAAVQAVLRTLPQCRAPSVTGDQGEESRRSLSEDLLFKSGSLSGRTVLGESDHLVPSFGRQTSSPIICLLRSATAIVRRYLARQERSRQYIRIELAHEHAFEAAERRISVRPRSSMKKRSLWGLYKTAFGLMVSSPLHHPCWYKCKRLA